MRTMQRVCTALVAPVAVLAIASSAGAQSFQGGMRGSVKDAQGVIPGVTITLVNEATNVSRDTASNHTGEYSFPALDNGTYTVKATVQGFKTFERQGIRVGTQQFITLDITLEMRC